MRLFLFWVQSISLEGRGEGRSGLEDWKKLAERLKFEEGKSWTEVARAIKPYFPDLSDQQRWEKVRGVLRRTEAYKKRGKVTFEDAKEPTPEDVDDFYETLKKLNAATLKLEKKQTQTTIHIEDDKPVGIAFWGDWHLGGKGVDYDQFDKDEELIGSTDGLYVVGMGDYKENASALVHQAATQENLVATDMQDKIVMRKFECTADKHLVTIRGCHDDWDKRNANKDFVQALCDITGAINLWHGGIINLIVNNVEYRIGARHKYKYESSLNTTNSQRNFVNNYGPCDVVAIAHKHFCEVEHTQRMGSNVIYLRSGSYKRYDEYGQKLAGYEGIHGVPVVIFYPDRRFAIPFKRLEDGVAVLQSLRQ